MSGLPPPTKTPPFPIVTADQRSVLGIAFTFAILPVIAVALRLVARRIAQRTLDASDYCIILACVFAVTLEGVSITGVIDCGIGYDHTVNIVGLYGMEPVTKLLKVCLDATVTLFFKSNASLTRHSSWFPSSSSGP